MAAALGRRVGVLGMNRSCEEQKADEQDAGFHGCSRAGLQPHRRGGALRIRGAAGALPTLLSIRRNGRTRGSTHLAIINWFGLEGKRGH